MRRVILLFDGIITANTPPFHSRSHICKEKKTGKFTAWVSPERFPISCGPDVAGLCLQANSFPCGIPGTARSTRLFLGKPGSSGAKVLLSEWVCSSEPLGVSRASFCGNSSSFCPCRLRRAGLMSGRRKRRDPELEVTDPATDGAGDGMRDGAPLPDSSEKGSAIETPHGRNHRVITPVQQAQFSWTVLRGKGMGVANVHQCALY